MNNEKEIPFGAFDSELMRQEITIPEGFEATIDGNKIILKKIESEDERIRKELIEHVKDQQSSFISAPDCRDKYEEEENNKYNSWLAWLEKQGEQEPAKTVKWSPQEKSCICQLESLVKEQWRQAECVHNSVNIKKMQELMFFLKTLNPNKKPQRMISAEAKEALLNESEREALRTEYEKGRADVIAEMQKEWSKEDENHVISLLERLEGLCRNEFERTRFAINEDQDWLNSLKDRYTWKPSDEQIRALEYIINNAHNTSYSCKIAKELLEQLKKLKGE